MKITLEVSKENVNSMINFATEIGGVLNKKAETFEACDRFVSEIKKGHINRGPGTTVSVSYEENANDKQCAYMDIEIEDRAFGLLLKGILKIVLAVWPLLAPLFVLPSSIRAFMKNWKSLYDSAFKEFSDEFVQQEAYRVDRITSKDFDVDAICIIAVDPYNAEARVVHASWLSENTLSLKAMSHLWNEKYKRSMVAWDFDISVKEVAEREMTDRWNEIRSGRAE